ncbi:MAG: biotin transporter BioY [Eubacterium sp.]|nr:biotin transporter BioY [Eubacterium sp.]
MNSKARSVSLSGLFAALIAVGAFIQIKIPLPLYEMHFTLQWFFVVCAALLLGTRGAVLSVGVYLLIGLAGVPVFAAGGGPAYVLRPGFGFLLGFLFAAPVISGIAKAVDSFVRKLLAAVIGMVVYYTVGAAYFYLMKNLYAGEAVAWKVVIVEYCLITVLPDLLLCLLAALLSNRLQPRLNRILNGGK